MSVTYISVALRNFVYERADGCCEYCLIPEAVSFAKHQIDYVVAEKHSGQTIEENLACPAPFVINTKAVTSLRLIVRPQ